MEDFGSNYFCRTRKGSSKKFMIKIQVYMFSMSGIPGVPRNFREVLRTMSDQSVKQIMKNEEDTKQYGIVLKMRKEDSRSSNNLIKKSMLVDDFQCRK